MLCNGSLWTASHDYHVLIVIFLLGINQYTKVYVLPAYSPSSYYPNVYILFILYLSYLTTTMFNLAARLFLAR